MKQKKNTKRWLFCNHGNSCQLNSTGHPGLGAEQPATAQSFTDSVGSSDPEEESHRSRLFSAPLCSRLASAPSSPAVLSALKPAKQVRLIRTYFRKTNKKHI